MNETLIAVHPVGQRAHIVQVEVGSLQDLHYDTPADGSIDVLHAYVSPSALVSGGLPAASDAPRVLVCIRRRLNTRFSFARLLDIAEEAAVTPRSYALL